MIVKSTLAFFEGKKIRRVWDGVTEKRFFSVIDVVSILSQSADGRKYWNKLKERLKVEGSEVVTNCHGLKLSMPMSRFKNHLQTGQAYI